MAEYDQVHRGSLKLKGVDDHGMKKKKTKHKKEIEAKKRMEEFGTNKLREDPQEASSSSQVEKRTKTEIAFEKSKQKKNAQAILEKASKTHKERILDFNRHLDSMSEHYDIPKVSWTK